MIDGHFALACLFAGWTFLVWLDGYATGRRKEKEQGK
jgi:hypothetical protein